MPACLVFKRTLLNSTETFVAAQARSLTLHAPVMAGFLREPSGLPMLAGLPLHLLEDYTAPRKPTRMGFLFRKEERLRTVHEPWRRALALHAPALVHAHFGPDGVSAMPLARTLDVPLVVTFHGYDITRPFPGYSYTYYRERLPRLFDEARSVIAVSSFIAERLAAEGCPEHKLVVHPTGVDLSTFTAEKAEDPRPTVLFVGRLTSQKACGLVLEAAAAHHVVVAGDGVERAGLEERAVALGASVEFLGAQSAAQVAALLRRAWVLCVPSLDEGFGMVSIEAQAMKTPVVGFASGGLREAVEHERTGLLVPPSAGAAALKHALDLLIADPALRARMGAAGRARVEARFDLRRQAVALEALYAAAQGRR